MENKPPTPPEEPTRTFQPKILLIWLAILAVIVGLVVSQSGTKRTTTGGLNTIDQLLTAAKEDRVELATIQSNPKGGEEWYVITGDFTNPSYDPQASDTYQTLKFLVEGRVTESEYKELRAILGDRLHLSQNHR